MAPAVADIPDDWEHVDDSDNYSVISLPASEADTIDPSQDQPAIPELSGPELEYPCRQPHSEGFTRNRPHPRDTDGDISKNQASKRSLTDTIDDNVLNTPRVPSREPVNNDSDLDAICTTTKFLIELIPEILAGENHTVIAKYYISMIESGCVAIYSHLGSLLDILNGYAKHRRLGSRLAELPVGLSEWLDKLKVELLRIRDSVNGPKTLASFLTPVQHSSQLFAHGESLKCFINQMDGLMAVIQSDYEDFHTLRMPMLAPEQKDVCPPSRRECRRPFSHLKSGNHNLTHLRRELYTLKDQIVACLGEIHSCEHRGISDSSDQRRNITVLTLNYKKTKESLELMLSNHGGDWIDYSVAGGLTFPEFSRLNTDTIRSLIVQLKEVTDDLFLERCRALSISHRSNPNALSEDDGLVKISPTIMNTLRTIEEVLVSILQIRK